MEHYEVDTYGVIVIGTGHAGSEAALAVTRMGLKTLLLTINSDVVAFMPCNPSVGGPAKGVVVRKIDALGGGMGRNIDKTYIQMRMLNTEKSPAVRALRAQADKHAHSIGMKHTIKEEPNLTLGRGIIGELIVEDDVYHGVVTSTGASYRARAAVITAGTALREEIIISELKCSSGPNNSQPSIGPVNRLRRLGFTIERFKTGTPPRVKSSTIDYSVVEEQPSDKEPNHFSFSTPDSVCRLNQESCWLTYTGKTTHQIIRDSLHRAPMFTGIIEGVGACYYSSIEDKIVRFANKPCHQLFLELEGLNTEEVYIQGLSASLPGDVQVNTLRSIAGLEKVEVIRTGYVVECDVMKPRQLRPILEAKIAENFYTAGQTNDISGYEKVAGRELIADINAALKVQGKEPLVIKRSGGYIGVIIDDLVTKGTNKPYRLLTSRAEYRLLLRRDNADLRLTEMGHRVSLVKGDQYENYLKKKEAVEQKVKRLMNIRIKPTEEVQGFLTTINAVPLKDGVLAGDLLRHPGITYAELLRFIPENEELTRKEIEQVEIQIRYEDYIKKAMEKVEKLERMEAKKVPESINYAAINGLATEAKQKLLKVQPETIAKASRISGVSPAGLSILMVHIEQGKITRVSEPV